MTGSGLLAQRGMFAFICFVDQRATVASLSRLYVLIDLNQHIQAIC
jgi:hypothetical protein